MRRHAYVTLTAILLSFPLTIFAQARRVELLCHRTANEDVPENTLESLEQAALLGCDVVEIDLRRTLDGRIILDHDGFLERLTDGHGEVETTFYDDLRMRDAGSWMSSRFRGMHIVLFEDALRLAREQNIHLVLDMKDKGMGADVLGILKREQMLDHVEFGGEWEDVKALYPQANHTEQPAQWVAPGVTEREIEEDHRQGKRVIVNFSANKHEMDLAEMKAAVAAGADGINVDFPRLGADAVGRPVEERLHELAEQASRGNSDMRVRAILQLSHYRGFPLQEYKHWLLDEDEHVSRAAALALVMDRPEPQPTVFAVALRSSDVAPRVNAAWALGTIHAPASTVLPLLTDKDPRVLSEALVALAHMPGEVNAQPLVRLLSHPDSSVRGAASIALAVHQPDVAAMAIPRQIRVDADAEEDIQRRHARRGGGAFSQQEIDQLVLEFRCQMQMLKAMHMLNQPAAVHELEAEAFGPDDMFPEPNGAVAALMLWDHLAADPKMAVQELGSQDGQAADRAEWALIHAGPAVLPAVREALRSANPAISMRAIRIVAWKGDAASLAPLQAMQSAQGANAELATWAITKIHALQPVR